MQRKIKRTWQKLTADKRRFSLLCVLLFVGLLLWARIIVIARPARTAIAEPMFEVKTVTALTSDNVIVPVTVETFPQKNPFAVSASVFPDFQDQADNNGTQNTSNSIINDSSVASKFTLDAVMGEIAMINGRVVQIGDIVGPLNSNNPLRLEKVEGRSVIISAGNHRYVLTIAPPSR
ncbi:MAG: hypothetical protein H8E83_02925 [Planctomycetes bacterium]|nr:hypothetical protein [Planctomycetota bacterium]